MYLKLQAKDEMVLSFAAVLHESLISCGTYHITEQMFNEFLYVF